MGDTPAFLLLTLFATGLVCALLLWNQSVRNSEHFAQAFYVFCLVSSGIALFLVSLRALGLLNGAAWYAPVLRILIYRGWIVIGTAVSAAIFVVLSANLNRNSRANGEAIRAFITSPNLLKGLCLSVAVSFICTEIGKLTHDADMRQFFLQSGYPVWFLYFVIVCETLGSIGLLIPQTLLPAAAGLIILMTGAIRTHAHNGDPFSDSLEALHLLILLVCIIVIRFRSFSERRLLAWR